MQKAPRLPSGSPRRLLTPGAGWAGAVAVAVLAASRWLDAPTVQYVVVWALATVGAAAFSFRVRGAQRGWAIACVVFLSAGVIIGARSQRELAQVTANWSEWQETRARAGLEALQGALTDAERELANSATAALATSPDRETTFTQLQALVRGPDERGIVVYRGDSAWAWAGRFRSAPDTLTDATGVSASDFYLTLYATERRGSDRAVATVLLSAAPPADRLSRPLSQRVAHAAGLDDFIFSAAGTTTGPGSVLHFDYSGRARQLRQCAPTPHQQAPQRRSCRKNF